MGDISLILGTVLSQLCIGTFITGFLLYKVGKIDENTGFRACLAGFVVGVIGLGAMILHLGHPFLAFNAFFNLGSSWLSREVLFYGGFLGFAFLFLVAVKLKKEALVAPCGIIASVLGVIAVFVTSLIYTIPSIPSWYSLNTPVSFALTAVLLGVSFGVFLGKPEGLVAGGANVVGAASFAALLVTVVHVTTLLRSIPAAAGSAQLILDSPMFVARLVVLAIVGIFAVYMGTKKKASIAASHMGIMFALLLVSEFIGRILFFGTIVRL